jgi:hypothetical protein
MAILLSELVQNPPVTVVEIEVVSPTHISVSPVIDTEGVSDTSIVKLEFSEQEFEG